MAAATRPARTAAKRCSLSIANWTSCAGCTHQHCCAVVSLPLTGRCPALVHRSRCSGFVVNNVNHCERAGVATVKSRPFWGAIYAFQHMFKRRSWRRAVRCDSYGVGWVSMRWLPRPKFRAPMFRRDGARAHVTVRNEKRAHELACKTSSDVVGGVNCSTER